MSFPERLKLVIKELGETRNSFSEKLGYKNNTTIYDYTKEGAEWTPPGYDFFQKLVQAKTGINIEWLLSGEGESLQKNIQPQQKSNEAAVTKEREALIKDLEAFRTIASQQSVVILNLSGGITQAVKEA